MLPQMVFRINLYKMNIKKFCSQLPLYFFCQVTMTVYLVFEIETEVATE